MECRNDEGECCVGFFGKGKRGRADRLCVFLRGRQQAVSGLPTMWPDVPGVWEAVDDVW